MKIPMKFGFQCPQITSYQNRAILMHFALWLLLVDWYSCISHKSLKILRSDVLQEKCLDFWSRSLGLIFRTSLGGDAWESSKVLIL